MDELEKERMNKAGETPENSAQDTYDLFHKNFDLFGGDEKEAAEPAEADVKNSGEIYFSAQGGKNHTSDLSGINFSLFTSEPEKSVTAPIPKVQSESQSNTASLPKVTAPTQKKPPSKAKTEKEKAKAAKKRRKEKRKQARREARLKSFFLVLVILGCVALVSYAVKIPVLNCMNDVLALDGDDQLHQVVLEKNMSTSEVLDLLQEQHLIYSANFCKIISNLLGYARVREYEGGPYVDRQYPAGTYYLSTNMGVEGMLREIISLGEAQATVKLTFPEGFTVDQIVQKLSLNGVASENALYDVLDSEDFYEAYDFLEYIDNKEQRYRQLEGYLYPDTYVFYVGENPISVFNRFLTNFGDKWAESFSSLAEKSDLNIDQILTIASILQKEANDTDQMYVISSIIYNRLGNDKEGLTKLQCDSTRDYILAHEAELSIIGSFNYLLSNYDTYDRDALPVGPICNPGADAIKAAMQPAVTTYLYFLHDSEGRIHLAETSAQHEENKRLYLNK